MTLDFVLMVLYVTNLSVSQSVIGTEYKHQPGYVVVVITTTSVVVVGTDTVTGDGVSKVFTISLVVE